MTYLQLINKVLIRLREDTVTDLSASYTLLIGEFINDAKKEVENSWNWVQLRTTIQVPTVAGSLRYTLTGSGNRFKMLYVNNDTDNYELQLANSKWMTSQITLGGSSQGQPSYYDLNGTTTAGDFDVDLFPTPDKEYIINYNMIVPQADLVEITDSLLVSEQPVILSAYAKAISERGEDSGLAYRDALINAEKSLSDAIAIDATRVPSELIWETV